MEETKKLLKLVRGNSILGRVFYVLERRGADYNSPKRWSDSAV